jgi:hypothetical protein
MQRKIHNLFIYPCVFALPTQTQKKPQTQNSKTRDVQMSFKLFVFGFATLLLLSNCCFFPFFTRDPNSKPNRRKAKLCYILVVVLIACASVVVLEDGMCAHE